jgi:preprotein translocase subunit SecY
MWLGEQITEGGIGNGISLIIFIGIIAHYLRHTAASLAIDAGEPLHRLRDRLGHSSVLVTSRYLHVMD